MRIFIFLTCTLTFPIALAAQQIDTPLEAERLDLASCLTAIDPLPATYRSHLSKSCVAVPLKICNLRGAEVACLEDTNRTIQGFYAKARPKLPKTIAGSPVLQRGYIRGLTRADELMAAPVPGDPAASYTQYAGALVELFYRARQAKIEF